MGAGRLTASIASAPRLRGRGAHQKLHLCTLSEGECVLYVDAQIANRALDFRVAEQNLHGAQSQNRMAQTCCGFSGRLAPIIRPTFHGRRFLATESYSECSIVLSSSATTGQEENKVPHARPLRPLAESGTAVHERQKAKADIRRVESIGAIRPSKPSPLPVLG